MKKLITIALIAFLGVAFSSVTRAEDSQKTKEIKKQETCPVMGGKINKKLYVDYKGKRIYVCCGGCIGKVKADPEKYIKQLEAKGITLDKVPAKDKEAASAKKEEGEKHHHKHKD